MRILQLIDSLEAGGAERMAVNYANALHHAVGYSALVATRAEGPLKEKLASGVDYFFMNKKSVLDFKALFRLKKFVKNNKIEIVQAHSSSFFTAVLLKIIAPNLKIFWHDHYGKSEFLETRPKTSVKVGSLFFAGIFAVNENLKRWSQKNLLCKRIIVLPNFIDLDERSEHSNPLHGIRYHRITCVANFRSQKNHLMALEVARLVTKHQPNWSFHFVGKSFSDDYFEAVQNKIEELKLREQVFLYPSSNSIDEVIQQSTICILTSASEGLPVGLLEYGKHAKPVVATNVGQVDSVIEDGVTGYLIPSGDPEKFADAILKLIESETLRHNLGENLFQKVKNNYTFEAISNAYFQHLNLAK